MAERLFRDRRDAGAALAWLVERYRGRPDVIVLGLAADDWGGSAERKSVRPALADSVEELFHEVGEKGFLVSFGVAPGSAEVLRSARLERAIGVIYRPETERQSTTSGHAPPTSSTR